MYHVQFFILILTTSLHWNFFTNMSNFHSYSIFETILSLFWNVFHFAININIENLTQIFTLVSLFITFQKSILICKFCSRIKTFAILMKLWDHFYYKHDNIEKKKRLSEIKRTTKIWIIYWAIMKKKKMIRLLKSSHKSKMKIFVELTWWNEIFVNFVDVVTNMFCFLFKINMKQLKF